MLTATTLQTITRDWVKVSDSNCILQSNNNEPFNIAIHPTKPNTEAYIRTRLADFLPISDTGVAIWCRLGPNSIRTEVSITVIK